MRRRWVELGLLGGVLVGACVDLEPYLCTDDEECRAADGDHGWCERTGFCSYPDDDCDSGRRYSELAGPLARSCTGPMAGTGTGTTGPTLPSTSIGTAGSSSDGDGSSDGSGGPECGNGVLDPGEECDDGDDVDGDGCNTDCVRGGSILWSEIVAGRAGNDDRYFGLTSLASGGEVVAVGYIEDTPGNQDVLISRWTVHAPDHSAYIPPIHLPHDVEGGDDEALAVIQGGLGRLYICGRAQIGMSAVPWVSRWDASLTQAPTIDEAVPGVSGTCFDITFVDSNDIVAVGGNGNNAWAYSFPSSGVAMGTLAEVDGVVDSEIDTNFKAAATSPSGQLYIAGQLSDLAVVYTPLVEDDLGFPVLTSKVEIQPQSMVVTQETYILGGLLRDGGDSDDLWIAAFDGNVSVWTYAPAMPAIDEVEDITRDPAGNIYAIGHVTEDNNNPDRWVGKLDPEGNLVWQRNDYPLSELGDDRGRSIVVLPVDEDGDGNDDGLAVLVVAEIFNMDGDRDAWIARLAP